MTENQRESPGRRDYDDPNAALNAHIEENDKRLRRFFIGAIVALSIIAIATTISLVGFGIVLREQQRTADKLEDLVRVNRQFTDRLATLVVQNNNFAVSIQKQRREAILDSCKEQTKRHELTVRKLIEGSNVDQQNAPNEAVRKEIRRRRDVTIGLIDALAPVENCEAKVKQAVQGG